ncbi:MAG: BamA/TamA family outer membrane protein [Balneola sp.]|nr:BamA/TamA family outer membrane protein [Balneola sp.]MBO6652177.1 BamA/TamA family outer membrane protein [Balneola sp.]MBO6710696.1 BamA/TamA family outer membrane protein [Balneola sp.]MBO6799382.1 BamA/TamA family outer membrane protein [Balneola sp.]MBO6869489.1 BamA/TamA family outer membrane protein [Balneola sp.]
MRNPLPTISFIILSFLFTVLLTSTAQVKVLAQNASVVSDSTSNDVVRRIRFSGNKNVKDRTLETLIRTKTNREFLGIPRFTPWYYFWELSNGRFGEDPIYLDRSVVANDMERIRLYYESLGYLRVNVDTTIVEYKTDKVEVSFIVTEGTPSKIETISYKGLPFFATLEKRIDFMRDSPLTRDRINDSTYTVNRQYNTQELGSEQQRIINFLKNNGYASIQKDSVIALVQTQQQDSTFLDVQFRINPGKVFRFGDVHISLADGTPPDNYTQIDTVSSDQEVIDTTRIFLKKEPAAQTKFSLLTDQILFKPGDVYNHELYLNTIREYQNLGMLFIRRFGQNQEGSQPDFSQSSIPTYLDLQSLTKHSIGAEIFGMKRYGFGTGLGVDYTNNNAFGKAENFSLSANVSFEFVSKSVLEEIADTSTQSSIFRSYELRGDYTVPRLNFPFAFLDNTRFFTSGLTRYSLSYSRSDQLFFDINSDVQFNLRYEVQHNPRFSSFLDLIELDIVDPSPTDEFINNLRNDFGSGTSGDSTTADPIELTRILEDFRPQISSVIRYTFRNQNTDLIKRNRGYFSEYSISTGGNIPYIVDKYVVTPDTLEQNLPSLFKVSENELSYSRYIKATADYRKYIPISNSAVFAWRLYGGIAQPYGSSTTIPLNRRFFAGGSNDIRGWGPFQLGPGSIKSEDVRINGGEIKLAAFTEARQIFIRDVIGANWHAAWYVDAGNIWYGPKNDAADDEELEDGRFKFNDFYNQIAVGTGLGLRLDWEYIVARFDFTFRAHDLEAGWFNNKKLYFSFGIGHSF